MKLLTHFGNSANYKASWTISVHHPRSRGGRIDTESVGERFDVKIFNDPFQVPSLSNSPKSDITKHFDIILTFISRYWYRYSNTKKEIEINSCCWIFDKISDVREQFHSSRVFVYSIYIWKFISVSIIDIFMIYSR